MSSRLDVRSRPGRPRRSGRGSGVGGAGEFTPASLDGLELWLPPMSDPGSVAVDGLNVVTQINDASGNARHYDIGGAVQFGVGIQINGLEVLDMDAGADVLTPIAPWTLAQPFTVCHITRVLGTLDASRSMFWLGTTFLNGTSTGTAGAGAWQFKAGTLVSSATQPTNNPSVITGIFNGASSALRVNGAQVVAGNIGTAGITAGHQFGDAAFNGIYDQGDIVVVSSALAGDDLAALEAWAMTLAGLA